MRGTYPLIHLLQHGPGASSSEDTDGEDRMRPGADVRGVSPVPVQVSQAGEPSPGADVAGASPVPVQMWQG